MKVFDRFSARWRAGQDRKMLKEAGRGKGTDARKRRKKLPEPTAITNRATRRAYIQASARRMRLHTHMRRPLVAVRCRGEHATDQRRAQAEARKAIRRGKRAVSEEQARRATS